MDVRMRGWIRASEKESKTERKKERKIERYIHLKVRGFS
jgi:hypothetical protein